MLSRPAHDAAQQRRSSEVTAGAGRSPRPGSLLLNLLRVLALALVTVLGTGTMSPVVSFAPSAAFRVVADNPTTTAPVTATPAAHEQRWRQPSDAPSSNRPNAAEACVDSDDLDSKLLESSREPVHAVAIASQNAGPLTAGARARIETRVDPSRFTAATDLARGPPA